MKEIQSKKERLFKERETKNQTGRTAEKQTALFNHVHPSTGWIASTQKASFCMTHLSH
jgi:hypothetical protein